MKTKNYNQLSEKLMKIFDHYKHSPKKDLTNLYFNHKNNGKHIDIMTPCILSNIFKEPISYY